MGVQFSNHPGYVNATRDSDDRLIAWIAVERVGQYAVHLIDMTRQGPYLSREHLACRLTTLQAAKAYVQAQNA